MVKEIEHYCNIHRTWPHRYSYHLANDTLRYPVIRCSLLTTADIILTNQYPPGSKREREGRAVERVNIPVAAEIQMSSAFSLWDPAS